MIRPLLTELALFLTPFALYAMFLMATRNALTDSAAWPWRVVGGLLIASCLLLLGSFVILAHFSGAAHDSTYVPAHVEDGKLVPGRIQ
ncbi:MAG TPA: DUF6111 family protein [Xanthobacteraceae bacterium]|jgi:heme/copper-type cytochrome/quinol oxidase subunit 3